MLQVKFQSASTDAVDLNRARITIGRDESNDLVLTQSGISGFHAEFQAENGRVFLIDLGSSNGTFVNGKKVVGRQEVQAWDRIAFEKVAAEIVDTEKRRPTQVSRAISDEDLQRAVAPGATQMRAAVSGFSLQGTSGPVTGKNIALAGKMIVGREEGCDLQIDERMVSRRHAEIEATGDVLKIRDLGSANGTYVNGDKVSQAVLKPGDEVRFDQLAFRVEGGGDDTGKTALRPAIGGEATALRPAVGDGTTTMETPKAGLTVSTGELSGKRFALSGSALTIGRIDDNDIVLPDSTVSSAHARLVAAGSGWKIEDAGSSNGTFVNDKRVTAQDLKDGDKIRLGRVELEYDEPASTGTTVFEAISDADAEQSSAKKGLPAWAYGLVGFLLVAGAAGIWYWQKGPAQITAKLQGNEVWSRSLSDGRRGPTTPVLADINGDRVLDAIVADAGGYVLALDGITGKNIIEAEVPGSILAPPAAGDLTGDGIADLVVASNSGVVVALNGQGKTLWTSPGDLEPGAVLNRPVLADVNEDGVSDVILPTVDKGLVALDGTRGWKLWDTAGMTRGKMITTPVKADINGDKTADFIGVTDAGQVLAVTGRDGKVWQIWEAEVAPVYYASPLLVDTGERNLVVIATDGGGIVALDAASGRSIWSADVKNRFFASPVAADANGDGVPDVVAVAENGDIHLLNGLTGREIWSSALGVGVQGSPALFDMNNDELADLVLLDLTGKIQVIDIARGGVLMTREVPGAGTFVASPVLADLNNDQLVEIVTAGQSGVITSFAVNRTIRRGHAAWPMFLGNDRHGLE